VRRPSLALALALAAGILLTGCAGPDPELVRDEAQAVFDDLVARAAESDTAVVRTVETAEPAEQACAGDDERTQTGLTATATLSITTTDADTRRIRDELADTLDPETWTTIHPAVAEQGAWISEHDVVVTLTSNGPALVIAVFTPCTAR
jgi:hypothetical protein